MIVTRPPMGWNSWNTFGGDINEDVVKETARAIVDTGLRDAGYQYVVIDDCWSVHSGRDENGRLIPNPEKFPSGMKALADYIHSLGLKFGIYSCDGSHTCAGFPASFDHEFVDAEQFAEWGVDYLKYDNCWKPSMIPGRVLYNKMALALRATGRDILFSACNWGTENSHEWMSSVGAHMYRSTFDIADSFESVKDLAVAQIDKYTTTGYNCFNDLDMLICGMNGKGNVGISGCTLEEYTLHFALWCFWGAPLMLGADLRKLDDFCHDLLTNKELIRLNQDPECRPPYIDERQRYHNLNKRLAGIKMLDNNEFALGLFNYSDDAELEVLAYFDDLGIPSGKGIGLELTDIFTGETFTKFDFYTPKLPAMTCKIYRAKIVKR